MLRRRLAFLSTPSSFFYDGDRPVRAEEIDDPYRRGLLTIARATSRAELAWLRETLASLDAVITGNEAGDGASGAGVAGDGPERR